ncbi:MAG: C-terminal binding protein [Anaerolineaceae bacterium]|jgi:D-3-phosphoglycerate dehydrogenase|nr:C-terminal binding protein [Anaerolineaceae bacterium]
MKFKLLITSSNYSDGSLEREMLSSLGVEVIVENSPTEEQIIEHGQDANGILVGYTPIGIKAFQELNNLGIIVRTGIGVENINLNVAKEKNIRVCNVPDYCLNEVADHAMALLLSLERKIVYQSNLILQNGKWEGVNAIRPIYGLSGRILGLVGFGGIGRNVAKRAQSFGLKVFAFDPFANKDIAHEYGVELVPFKTLVTESDYLSLHAPLTDSTKHIINSESLSLMKASTYLINTSRGGLVDNNALFEALTNKKLAGAGLDVIEDDLAGALRFREFQNVIITPHTGYYSLASSKKMRINSAEEIARFIKGEKLKNQLV